MEQLDFLLKSNLREVGTSCKGLEQLLLFSPGGKLGAGNISHPKGNSFLSFPWCRTSSYPSKTSDTEEVDESREGQVTSQKME